MKGINFRRVVSVLGLSVAAGAVALAGVSSASASTNFRRGIVMGDAHALTRIVADPDSGGNGNWAYDNFLRSSRVFYQGSAPLADCVAGATVCYAFTATIQDQGVSVLIPGAFAPNQGAPFTGQLIRHRGLATMRGYGDFTTFYADAMPSAHLVPHFISGSPDSSAFPGRFFPAGAVSGLNEATWSYGYLLPVRAHVLVWSRWLHRWVRVTVTRYQHWTDAYNNDGGQVPAAGQITG